MNSLRRMAFRCRMRFRYCMDSRCRMFLDRFLCFFRDRCCLYRSRCTCFRRFPDFRCFRFLHRFRLDGRSFRNLRSCLCSRCRLRLFRCFFHRFCRLRCRSGHRFLRPVLLQLAAGILGTEDSDNRLLFLFRRSRFFGLLNRSTLHFLRCLFLSRLGLLLRCAEFGTKEICLVIRDAADCRLSLVPLFREVVQDILIFLAQFSC
jgi:hypothetical protein